MEEPIIKVAQRSRFKDEVATAHSNGHTKEIADGATNGAVNGDSNGKAHEITNGNTNGEINENNNEKMEKLSFIDNESKFRLAFSQADEGKAQLKTTQVRSLFLRFLVNLVLEKFNKLTKNLVRLSTFSASTKSRPKR